MIINDEQNENDRIGDHERRDRISTVSEMVTHERAMATNGMPSNVSNLSITKSSHVHFGPKFVNVTVEDTEGIKGRILGLELVSANSKRRLRCSVAVFVCWALIAISALAAYLFLVILPRRPTRMDIEVPIQNYLWKYCKQTTRAERLSCAGVVVALIVCIALIIYFTIKAQVTADIIDDPAPHEWNITRDMWIAKSVEYDQNSTTLLYQPVHLVVIQHTVSTECHQFITCAAEVRNIQAYYLGFKMYDIPYNFLVGNDGRVYEGRGWGIGGAHTRGYNLCSVGIGFIGDYREEGNMRSKVTAAQVRSVQLLLDYGVKEGYLSPNYWVAGAKDLQASESPGSNLYNEIRSWQHYDNKHQFHNHTCAEIYTKVVDKN